MKTPLLLSALALVALPIGTTLADTKDPEQRKEVRVAIVGAPGSDVVDINVDGAAEHLALDDLADGETRTVTTADGTEIRIGRTDGAMSVAIDGEAIELPDVTELAGEMATASVRIASAHGAHPQAFATSEQVVHIADGNDDRGLMLISGRELDPTEREALEAAILATGLVESVRFMPALRTRTVEVSTDIDAR